MHVIENAGWSMGGNCSNSMDKRVLAKLGQHLRGVYQDTTAGPLPEILAILVREIEKRERSRVSAG